MIFCTLRWGINIVPMSYTKTGGECICMTKGEVPTFTDCCKQWLFERCGCRTTGVWPPYYSFYFNVEKHRQSQTLCLETIDVSDEEDE